MAARIFLRHPPTGLNRDVRHPAPATLLRPPFGRTDAWWYGNIDPFPIAYGFRPRLRDRLTLSRLALLRNPWAYGDRVSRPVYRYSCPHRHFQGLHPFLSIGLRRRLERSPTAHGARRHREPAASVPRLSPVTFSARAH